MSQVATDLAGKHCTIFSADAPACVLIQPTGAHELAGLAEEAAQIQQHAPCDVTLVSFPVTDWNRELSPWSARQAFGSEPFGGNAGETLRWILEELLPALALPKTMPCVLGGYSLAGLFSLWAAYQTNAFRAVAACSPSVWFDDWDTYIAAHEPKPSHVYLSLGNKEHKTRNPLLRTGKARILAQAERLTQCGVNTTLEWNSGNHFQDNAARTAKGFLWCAEQLAGQEKPYA